MSELAARGIDTLVDGAHAGMVATDLAGLGAAYYTGNLHKWFSSPKGAGFLHVRRDRQEQIRPIVISHGTNSPRAERSRFRLEFDWMGTVDPTAYLAFPAALDFFEALVPGGWLEASRINRETVLGARRLLLKAFPPDPDNGTAPKSMIGSMASIELPADLPPQILEVPKDAPPGSTWPLDPLHELATRGARHRGARLCMAAHAHVRCATPPPAADLSPALQRRVAVRTIDRRAGGPWSVETLNHHLSDPVSQRAAAARRLESLGSTLLGYAANSGYSRACSS